MEPHFLIESGSSDASARASIWPGQWNDPSRAFSDLRRRPVEAAGAFGARSPQGEGIGDQGHGRAVAGPACPVDLVRGDPDNGWDGGAVPSGIDAGRSIEPDAERIGRECFAIVDHGQPAGPVRGRPVRLH